MVTLSYMVPGLVRCYQALKSLLQPLERSTEISISGDGGGANGKP